VTWHKIGGIAVYSCPRPGSWNAVPSFCMFTASLVHLVPLSDSLSRIVDSDMLITWLSWLAWSVKADLFCSDKLDGRWLLVTGLLVVASTLSCVLSVLSQTSSQSHLCKSSHSYCTEFCTLSLWLLPSLVCPSDAPVAFSKSWQVWLKREPDVSSSHEPTFLVCLSRRVTR